METGEVTVETMLSKDWHTIPESIFIIAAQLAPKQVANYTERQKHGRTPEELLEHAKRGLIAELWHNYLRHSIGWWRQHWDAAQAAKKSSTKGGDDGGVDDRDGCGVKVILWWQKFVPVSDTRPNKQFVYELDESGTQIRLLGTFRRIDRQWIDWANLYGVLRSSIK